MPGLLGDCETLPPRFRTPIEKKRRRRQRACWPTRRSRSCCAGPRSWSPRELPPKTEIVQPVELAGAQRDLYETVRLAMHDKVREEIAAKGFARSHIAILDALLKLRQVCCDPRLVKIAAARKVGASAKLEHLIEMRASADRGGPAHPDLLAIHQHARSDRSRSCERAGIDFVELTGDTRDRADAGQALPERHGAALPDQPARPAAPASTSPPPIP